MAEKNNQNAVPEQQNLSQLLQIRRDKLKELQESGNDPFQITKYVVDNDSANIKENFDGAVDYVVLMTQIASGDEVQKRVRSSVTALDDAGIQYKEVVELEGQNACKGVA